MWVRLKNGGYLNLATDKVIKVQSKGSGKATTHSVVVGAPESINTRGVLMDGYDTAEAAQAALDELMDGQDAIRVQPPVTEEEED